MSSSAVWYRVSFRYVCKLFYNRVKLFKVVRKLISMALKRVSVQILLLVMLLKLYKCEEESGFCNRKPFKTKTAPLAPDDRFALEINGVESHYIPNKEYTVKLRATDGQSQFIAFTIFASGDEKENEKNPRKGIPLEPGIISSSKSGPDVESDTIALNNCNNTVIQRTVSPKSEVEILWKAPPKGNKCVKIYAYVAVKRDVWYSSDGPLSKSVCEDLRKNEDMKPPENNNCNVCEDARYEVVFQGLWSYNTHPDMFPVQSVARFSDLVGASHDNNFILFKDDMPATEGLELLVLQGNTSKLEEQVLDNNNLRTHVRTLIKATAPPSPAMSTIASFRTSRKHHFVSLVTAILPSPDWFLGAYDIELCDATTSKWANYVVLNLYPMDAGVDSGTTFESSNEPTSPPNPIAKAKILPNKDLDKYQPFARLNISLVTTYPKSVCEAVQQTTESGVDTSEDNVPGPQEPVTSEPPAAVDPNADEDCPVTVWDDWQECEGECVDNLRIGFKNRFRSFMADGVAVDDVEESIRNGKLPEYCIERFSIHESEKCQETCESEDPEASRQLGDKRLRPGQSWRGRK